MKNPKQQSQSGFTLLEMMMAVLLLTIVLGAVFSQIHRAQTNYGVEGQKLDLTQTQGEFLDQFTRDLHQAGFPSAKSIGPANAGLAAAGLTAISSTSLTMEGDLDGTGVKTVTYFYDDGSSFAGPGTNPCPCLQRSAVPQGQQPAPFIAVQNVQPPGTQGIFTAYDANGAVVSLPPAALQNIKSVQITFTLQAGKDANGVTPIQTTMTGMARLPNN